MLMALIGSLGAAAVAAAATSLPVERIAADAASNPDNADEKVQLLPHRGVYDLSLLEASDKSGISDVRGLMVYDFSGNACDGYTTSLRFVTEFMDLEGSSQMTDLRSSSYESPDGNEMQFLNQVFVDQMLVEESKGSAEDAGDHKTVHLTMPEEQTFDIDERAIFPTAHLRKVIDAARAGEVLMLADVYDGSETGDEVFSTTTIIGAADEAAVPISDPVDEPQIEVPEARHWPVSIAYFEPAEPGAGDQVPAYQMSFVLYENGVSRDMKLDYGDFVLQGKLKKFEVLDEQDSCKK